MKTLSAELEAHYTQQSTTIATCWKATLRNGTIMGFTQHDCDINGSDIAGLADGVIYLARGGYTRSDIASNTNLDIDNNDIDGLFDSELITEDDLRAGLWDGAEIEIFEVNVDDLSMGRNKIRKGTLGQITAGRQQFHSEMFGMTYVYGVNTICELTQPGCRAKFGDQRCGLDLEGSPTILVGTGSPTILVPITYTGDVDTFDWDAVKIFDAARTQENGFFNFGKVTFTSGLNSGLTFEIRYYLVGVIALQVLPPFTVYPGDTYRIQRGCDKKFPTCKGYGNWKNFRGEPYLQGEDLSLQVARRKA